MGAIFTLNQAYAFAGLVFAAVAIRAAVRPSAGAWRRAAFWGLMSISFLFGSYFSDLINGFLVLALVAIGGLTPPGKGPVETTSESERASLAGRYRVRLLLPALAIPIVAVTSSLVLKKVMIAGHALIDPANAAVIGLMGGVLIALLLAAAQFRPRPVVIVDETRRLLDTVGWAAILPQMLAALGAVFALAKVGDAVGLIFTRYLPLDSRAAAVAAYCVGMALFTVVMGNAFAAFPVMTAAIGLPLVVQHFGGNPTVVAAIGMLSGFCGTLVTPMAANFNLVPAALLELRDRNGVIKVQAPSAAVLLLINGLLMYLLAFGR